MGDLYFSYFRGLGAPYQARGLFLEPLPSCLFWSEVASALSGSWRALVDGGSAILEVLCKENFLSFLGFGDFQPKSEIPGSVARLFWACFWSACRISSDSQSCRGCFQFVGGDKHKRLFGIVPGTDGVKLVYVFPFSLGKKGKHINKFPGNLRKVPGQSEDSPGTIPGQCRENVFLCFLSFFFGFGREEIPFLGAVPCFFSTGRARIGGSGLHMDCGV